jgi:hypothetical protein
MNTRNPIQPQWVSLISVTLTAVVITANHVYALRAGAFLLCEGECAARPPSPATWP